MIYEIKNSYMTVQIESLGAELMSVKGADGTEYLWQGDPAVWEGRSPVLFPYIGRLTDGRYTYKGKTYEMKIHGMAPYTESDPEVLEADRIVLKMESDETTKRSYPFDFVFRVCYELEENRLKIRYRVENRDDQTMIYAVGGHPGIALPLEEGCRFEDYKICFSEECHPKKIVFSEDCFVLGEEEWPLEKEKEIRLSHSLFDADAIVLKSTARALEITSDKGKKGIRVAFPGFPYIGFWHMPHMAAGYVCVEPWSSLPSRKSVVEDLETQPDLRRLLPGEIADETWELELF